MTIYPPIRRDQRKQSIFVDLVNASGAPVLGLLPTTVAMQVLRRRGGISTVTLVAIVSFGQFTANGFGEVDAVNCPGLYRVDIGNRFFVNDGITEKITIVITSATTRPYYCMIPLTDIDTSPGTIGDDA